MAKNIQMYIKNSNGNYEDLYPNTKASLITGALSIANGGTGSTTLAGAQTALGITDLKTSVSNGKFAIASAITDKGVSTSSTADFSTMANNIRNIQTGGNLGPTIYQLDNFSIKGVNTGAVSKVTNTSTKSYLEITFYDWILPNSYSPSNIDTGYRYPYKLEDIVGVFWSDSFDLNNDMTDINSRYVHVVSQMSFVFPYNNYGMFSYSYGTKTQTASWGSGWPNTYLKPAPFTITKTNRTLKIEADFNGLNSEGYMFKGAFNFLTILVTNIDESKGVYPG